MTLPLNERMSEELACLGLENRDESAERRVLAILGILGGGEAPFAVTRCQVIDIRLQLTIGFERKDSLCRLGCQAIAKERNKTIENRS